MADQSRSRRGSSRQNTGSGVSDETRRYDGGFLDGNAYNGYTDAAGSNGTGYTGYTGNTGYVYQTDSADYPPEGSTMDGTYPYGSTGYAAENGYAAGNYYTDGNAYASGNDYTAGTGYASGNAYTAGTGYASGNDYAAGGNADGDSWYTNAGQTVSGQPYQEAYRRKSSGPSMAQRASGKANNEIYGRPGSRTRQTTRVSAAPAEAYYDDYDYGYDEPAPRAEKRRRKRKRHHPLRNFLIFLLILAAIIAGVYFLLFRAPSEYEDGVHTRKSGFYNILMCATDEEGERTDTIMLLTIDQKNLTAKLTTIPRDTIVDNGDSVPKLNGVYTNGGCGEAGAEALMDEVKNLLGFRPDGYIIISYQVFEDAVDALGGVWFDVPMEITKDNANDYSDYLTIPAGEQLLDGEQALAVCRYREGYAMADIQRQYVQQEFIKAMLKQCLQPSSWSRLPAVYNAFMDNTITDLSGANIRYVGLWLGLCYRNGIVQNTLPGEGCTYNGASCYGLYGMSTVELVNEVMNPFEEDITLDDVDILTVSEGELVPSTSEGVAFDPSTYQYD